MPAPGTRSPKGEKRPGRAAAARPGPGGSAPAVESGQAIRRGGKDPGRAAWEGAAAGPQRLSGGNDPLGRGPAGGRERPARPRAGGTQAAARATGRRNTDGRSWPRSGETPTTRSWHRSDERHRSVRRTDLGDTTGPVVTTDRRARTARSGPRVRDTNGPLGARSMKTRAAAPPRRAETRRDGARRDGTEGRAVGGGTAGRPGRRPGRK